MEKIRGKYDNQIIIVIVVALLCAFIITGTGITITRGRSTIKGLEMQVEDQKEQMEQMIYELERCKEMEEVCQLERSVFNDIVNGRLSIEEGLARTPELLGNKNRIKY